MYFALALDDGTLHAAESEVEILQYVESIDVYDGNWAFFDDKGRRLLPRFTPRSKWKRLLSNDPGRFTLELSEEPNLRQMANRVQALVGFPGVNGRQEFLAWVASNLSLHRTLDPSARPLPRPAGRLKRR